MIVQRWIASAAVLGLLIVGMPPALAQERIVDPPSADALVAATNAMLQPADLAAPALTGWPRSDRRFSTGYFNPPGGQDPLPVCVSGPGYRTVSIPRDGAIGFLASFGDVSQYEYEYASASAAAKAWKRVSSDVRTRCTTSFTEEGVRTVNTARRIPGVPGGPKGWAVSTSGNLHAFTAVHLIDDTIQMVSLQGGQRAVPSTTRAALGALATSLADRWSDRDALPITQDVTVTKAERVMVQPQDVPEALPLASAADGGWSSFQGSTPASGPDVFCRGQATLPVGSETFRTVLFSGGDVLGVVGKGFVTQQVDVYASPELAQAAWQEVVAAVGTCRQNVAGPIPSRKPFERLTNGTSTVTVNGVPGVWSTSLSTLPDIDRGYTNGSYSVYLLAGDSIQEVTYGVTRRGITNVTVDQSAVDSLARILADRWVGYPG